MYILNKICVREFEKLVSFCLFGTLASLNTWLDVARFYYRLQFFFFQFWFNIIIIFHEVYVKAHINRYIE